LRYLQFGGEKVIQELKKIFSKRTQNEWIRFFANVDTPCELVMTLREAIISDLVKGRDMLAVNARGKKLLCAPIAIGVLKVTLGPHSAFCRW
jgi:crotonobetainyl-CoA:carnitine CoA-transferase CaiB-like acyl-CoA transferase